MFQVLSGIKTLYRIAQLWQPLEICSCYQVISRNVYLHECDWPRSTLPENMILQQKLSQYNFFYPKILHLHQTVSADWLHSINERAVCFITQGWSLKVNQFVYSTMSSTHMNFAVLLPDKWECSRKKGLGLHSIYHRLYAFRVKNTPGELHYLTGWFGTGE